MPVPEPTPGVTARATPRGALSPLATPIAARGASDIIEIAARRDLAQRLHIIESDVEVVSVERMELPMGSLGCGEIGGVQNQGLTIGDEITLRAGGQIFVYRSDGRRLVPCSPAAFPGGLRPTFVEGAAISAQPKIQDLAVADLAQQLGIATAAIQVVKVEEIEWPDASLGCPKPGMMYAQVIVPGYLVILETGGQTYEYHGTEGRIVQCRR